MIQTESPASINPLEFTSAAATKVSQLIAEEDNDQLKLRVYVQGGGCSGFSYKFDLTNERNSDDVVYEQNGTTILIDELSLVYMGGSVVDFVDDLIGQSFQIKNPNAVASCGCGTSFSV